MAHAHLDTYGNKPTVRREGITHSGPISIHVGPFHLTFANDDEARKAAEAILALLPPKTRR